MIGGGVFIAGSLLIPGLPIIAKPYLKNKNKAVDNEWNQYNKGRLKFVIKRLEKQKMIEILEQENGFLVKVTEKGKRKMLKYDLDNLSLNKNKWDRKWRIITYDVNENKKEARREFRSLLKKLQFLQLQKSVYLTPFSCENEIEYIRQIYGIGQDVVILTVSGLENESAYKQYFGLS